MTSIYDVDANELIEKAAEELKKIKDIEPPVWASYVKTGAHKERPPMNPGWWYFRAAAILRVIYKQGPVGVAKLRTKYGGKPNRGMKSERFYKGSGSIIRKVLQQLEKAELVKKGDRGLHKGRVITPKGKSFLDKLADKIAGKRPVKEKPKPEAEIKEKPTVKEEKQKTAEVKEKHPVKEEKKPTETPAEEAEKEAKPEKKKKSKDNIQKPAEEIKND